MLYYIGYCLTLMIICVFVNWYSGRNLTYSDIADIFFLSIIPIFNIVLLALAIKEFIECLPEYAILRGRKGTILRGRKSDY